jgi:hypothetical protein
MKIIEVDQFTSTGNIKTLVFKDATLDKISGGDSQAAKDIFGASFSVMEVEEDAKPRLGCVWFKEGQDGKCQFYKANYDLSLTRCFRRAKIR